ncbi:MAG TPA: hypothetical protein VMX38_06765 [Verrucomicrobiae bacterium]|nr:hypothetical protein [Verrucomicrobiae bacterium]
MDKAVNRFVLGSIRTDVLIKGLVNRNIHTGHIDAIGKGPVKSFSVVAELEEEAGGSEKLLKIILEPET